MKVYRIIKDGGTPLVLNNLQEWEDILGGIENDEVGDTYTITVVDMSETELNDLPEWGGF